MFDWLVHKTLILLVVYSQIKQAEDQLENGPSHMQVSGMQGIKIISDYPGWLLFQNQKVHS